MSTVLHEVPAPAPSSTRIRIHQPDRVPSLLVLYSPQSGFTTTSPPNKRVEASSYLQPRIAPSPPPRRSMLVRRVPLISLPEHIIPVETKQGSDLHHRAAHPLDDEWFHDSLIPPEQHIVWAAPPRRSVPGPSASERIPFTNAAYTSPTSTTSDAQSSRLATPASIDSTDSRPLGVSGLDEEDALDQLERLALTEKLRRRGLGSLNTLQRRAELPAAATTAAIKRRRRKPVKRKTEVVDWLAALDLVSLDEPSENPAVGPSTRECVACLDRIPTVLFRMARITSSCTHGNSACNNCIQQHIETQLSTLGWDHIQCMECPELLQHADVQRHATRAVFDRYDQLALRAALSGDADFIWCQGPGCSFGQIHEGGEDMPLIQCQACGFRMCATHNGRWHEDETCTAFDRRMNGDGPITVDDGADDIDLAAEDFSIASGLRRTSISSDNTSLSSDTSSVVTNKKRKSSIFGSLLHCLKFKSAEDSGRRRLVKRSASHPRLKEVSHAGSEQEIDDQAFKWCHTKQDKGETLSEAETRKAKKRRKKEEQERRAYKKRKEQERLGERTVRSLAKACPQCNWQIQKNGGCEHMTCTKCLYEFCWRCMANYEAIRQRGNSAHAAGCLFHR